MATNRDLVEAKCVTRKEKKRFFLKANLREADEKRTRVQSYLYSYMCNTHINKICLSIGGPDYCGE